MGKGNEKFLCKLMKIERCGAIYIAGLIHASGLFARGKNLSKYSSNTLELRKPVERKWNCISDSF